MSYKVFFVEDEIVTREGIRDNVDWQADGFVLCGEAPDGEMALPLLQTTKPDVLITDIKMPFMDGLELSRIVRDRMPSTKIVILSGHDEFEYAQEAIKLGVSEYLLKPVTVNDIHQVLKRVAATMDREAQEQETLKKLETQVQENRAALTERLLFKLLVGAISLSDAIEQSEVLGLSLLARCYSVVVIRLALDDPAPPALNEFQAVQEIVSGIVGSNPDIFVLRKDLEELVLILKGSTPTFLQEDRDYLIEQIRNQVGDRQCTLAFGVGSLRDRITDIGQSFIEALANVQKATAPGREASAAAMETAELLRVDKSAVQDYLRCGVKQDFDDFFDAFLLPLSDTAFHSAIVKNYIFVDLVFAAARFVRELGGEIEQVLPGLDHVNMLLENIQTLEQFRAQAHDILDRALTFRDGQATDPHAGVIQQARDYIEKHYVDAEISLQSVARRVGHSPCHFSTIFGEEMGKTFKEYLTEVRLKRAKELLRTTTLRTSDISDRVGYNDPHYFSLVFRKHTGWSPKEFRLQAQQGEK